MATVSDTIVREYFELHGFLVRQFRKYIAPAGREDDDIDFLVINPHSQSRAGERPFLLSSADLPSVERAVVIVKAWHTHVFSPAQLTNSPDLFRFLEKKSFLQAAAGFGRGGNALKLLAVPALPGVARAREQALAILRSKGLDGAISFRTMLADLVGQVESNRDYQKSDLLQTLRILKNYDFLKEQQLDLFRSKPKKPGKPKAQQEKSAAPAESTPVDAPATARE